MTRVRKTAYIALGANLSNPKESFCRALHSLEQEKVRIRKLASLWHSPAWPAGMGYPDYVNSVIEVETSHSAQVLLELLHAIEDKGGRRRSVLNAPRPLDLDILDYEGVICDSRPILPHPRMLDRPFVLLPLLEIAPKWRHPIRFIECLPALAMLPMSDVLSHHIIERNWWN